MNWLKSIFHTCDDLKITQLMYIEVDIYWITNKCEKCGARYDALIRYPDHIVGLTDYRIRLPDVIYFPANGQPAPTTSSPLS